MKMNKGEFVKTQDGKVWKTEMYEGGDYNTQDAWWLISASGERYCWPVEESKLEKVEDLYAELAGFEV